MSNPVITSIFTADPSAHVWEDGKIYIYASHDIDPPRGCDRMDRYHVFSSEDMVNWVDEGEILSSNEVSWGRPEGGFMWAPDCAFKNGVYYFYFPHPSESYWNDSWKIGVATSTSPVKDFTVQSFIPGLGGFAMIDPCVFIDDDGHAYIYYGGARKCQGGELGDDMMSLKSEMRDMEGLYDFHEATWVFKRNGIYYLTYSDNSPQANCMRYATSGNPLGPWTHRGVFLEPVGCETTHGSVVEYKGQWYLFYHNQEISGHGALRSVCIDNLYFNNDGSIKMVVQTKESVKPVGEAPVPKPGMNNTYYANDCVTGGGASVITRESGVSAVTNLHPKNSYCSFENINGFAGGRATISIYYSTNERLAKLKLTVNDTDYSLLNAVHTGNDQLSRAFITVRLNPGNENVVRLDGGNGAVDISYITVSSFGD